MAEGSRSPSRRRRLAHAREAKAAKRSERLEREHLRTIAQDLAAVQFPEADEVNVVVDEDGARLEVWHEHEASMYRLTEQQHGR